jgi:F-type H+-transporting ATPase subunit b
MGALFSQLGHLFLAAVPTVILVFLLFFILERILFVPITNVLKQREGMSAGALARAREQTELAETKARQYDEAFQAARQEVYKQREIDRKANVEQREAALRLAREQAEALITAARASLQADVVRAKADLDAACQPLAEEISQSLLGADSAPGVGGRV